MKLLVLLICCYCDVYGVTRVYTTTATNYDLDNSYFPSTAPWILQHARNLRDHHPTAVTSRQNDFTHESESDSGDEIDTHKALKDFLETYSQTIKNNKNENHRKTSQLHNPTDLNKEKPKSWNLLNVQKHNHPNEDKKGWVSLEPVPWSMSKISKWKSNIKESFPSDHDVSHNYRPVDSWNKYSSSDNNFHSDHHNHNKYRPQGNADDRYDENRYNLERPEFQRPSATYQHKVYVEPSQTGTRKPVSSRYQYKDKDCEHNHQIGDDIITDGMPPNFPSKYDSFKRRGTEIEMHPESHPFTGNGEWVLLSTTKGYKAPKTRQRSLESHPQSTGASHHMSRMVKLTVLPPLKDSKINMTTSHGGLLQVESTFETVEQAKRKFDKKQKMKKKHLLSSNSDTDQNQIHQIIRPTVATVPRSSGTDAGAVMAAVGAGMIPATMAMMVPLVMSGKRRRRRDLKFGVNSDFAESNIVELTLPKSV